MKTYLALLVLVAAFWASSAYGQAMFTGETGGKGASSVFIAASATPVRGFTTPANLWTAYTRGVHTRVDAFAFYGTASIFGRTQHYSGVGSNVGILKRARYGLDVAFLGFCSTPFNHRDQASTVLATFAPIASRPVHVAGYEITLYGGYLRSEPFGRRAGKLFTPSKATHNGIVGAVLPVSKSLLLNAEYDPGSSQQNIGLALLYLFPRK